MSHDAPRFPHANKRVTEFADQLLQRLTKQPCLERSPEPEPDRGGREPSVPVQQRTPERTESIEPKERTLSVQPLLPSPKERTLSVERNYSRTLVIETTGRCLRIDVPDNSVLVETVPNSPTFRNANTQTDAIELYPPAQVVEKNVPVQEEEDDDEPVQEEEDGYESYENDEAEIPKSSIHSHVSEDLQALFDRFNEMGPNENPNALSPEYVQLGQELMERISHDVLYAYENPDTKESKYSIGYVLDKYPEVISVNFVKLYRDDFMQKVKPSDRDYINTFFLYYLHAVEEAAAEQMVNEIVENNPGMLRDAVNSLVQAFARAIRSQ